MIRRSSNVSVVSSVSNQRQDKSPSNNGANLTAQKQVLARQKSIALSQVSGNQQQLPVMSLSNIKADESN